MWERTKELIPDGVQTLSKMPSKHVEGVYPLYIDRGDGAYIFDDRGNEFIDYPLGLGAILLGHANWQVNYALRERFNRGILFPISNKMETRLAEKLNELIPCAEQMRFVKTGSEATSAAVRIARAYTGRKGIVCAGYHGWHDWYNITTDKHKGVPEEMAGLCYQIKHGEFDEAKKLFDVAGDQIAAIICEPYIYKPADNYLAKLKALTRQHGTLLIFDEVVTGFRTTGYSAQKMYNITPDLSAFGKALGNGLPIGVVCGKKEFMKELTKDCFVSSTFGGELASITAAITTLEVMEKENGVEQIYINGNKLIKGFNDASPYTTTKCIGYPCRTFFKFPSPVHKSLFWQECIKKSVFFGYAQFISLAHNEAVIQKTIRVIQEVFDWMRDKWDEPRKFLDGNMAVETVRQEAIHGN